MGASTVTAVRVERNGTVGGSNGIDVLLHTRIPHEGDPAGALHRALEECQINSSDRIAATGRRFRERLNLTTISEPEALEHAYRFTRPESVTCPAVVSAGGETFAVYGLDASGQITGIATGNKCASGTGEFFLQQLRRLDVPLETAAEWAATQDPYPLSGRCSVFCKSDCTHATNKGQPKERVVAGLSRMMAEKVLELLGRTERRNIMVVGGAALNRMMIEYLGEEIEGLIVPDEAPYFEALGAALWALEHPTEEYPGVSDVIRSKALSERRLPPLKDAQSMVSYKERPRETARPGDRFILGLDVGSTTTKAVLLRRQDSTIVAGEYLRTGGDPVGASRKCYRSLREQVSKQVDLGEIHIEGLGVTGSGRRIAGLHALTEGVINEIIAHATAAAHFDPEVDTIFEIGGQDAKYTHLTAGVPSDYAMNEACSAGTGSFLEEAAGESLGLKPEEIAEVAIEGEGPCDLGDMCAAFIASDIKNALAEGTSKNDVTAGLVYSICMNYVNRVKGNRPSGNRIFMQGGVCYNRAVPLAMATLSGKPIVVPPEPGLMGAFGVALVVDQKIQEGLMEPSHFDLDTLVDRETSRGKTFICTGGGGDEECDLRCEVERIVVEGKTYPFGGSCTRYENLGKSSRRGEAGLDLVRKREELVYPDPPSEAPSPQRGFVGINRSLFVHTYYPLYSAFFREIGFEPVMPEKATAKGIELGNAAFCYPVELAHGFFDDLISREKPPDFLFLPHFKALPARDGQTFSQVCPLTQGEPFLMQSAFREPLERLQKGGTKMLTPLFDMTEGLETIRSSMVAMAAEMGVGKREAKGAFEIAAERQIQFFDEIRDLGRKALDELESDPERIAVALISRPYGGFAREANLAIPGKFSSRGVTVIPYDFLTIEGERSNRNMYWGIGQRIMQGSRLAARHPQLFGLYVTYFNCGPDSFLITYFRTVMGAKPSLTLELDSHTADAGLDTRIEAFLDIVSGYRRVQAEKSIIGGEEVRAFSPARIEEGKKGLVYVDSSGERMPLDGKDVTVIIPAIGRFFGEALSAALRGQGFISRTLPPPDEECLMLGRAHTTGKECLPCILSVGMLHIYLRDRQCEGEKVALLIPTGSGPCRVGQYEVLIEQMILDMELRDTALLALTSENSYAGLGTDFQRRAWWGILVSDILDDVWSTLLATAVDVPSALETLKGEWPAILQVLETGNLKTLLAQLREAGDRLARIPTKIPPSKVPTVVILGEIFVRRDPLSRRFLDERLAERGFAAVASPISEWMHYADFLVEEGLADCTLSWIESLKFKIQKAVMHGDEAKIRKALGRAPLAFNETVPIEPTVAAAEPHISRDLVGEAGLVTGRTLSEVGDHFCGAIAVGPLGCMPNRLAEAILMELAPKRGLPYMAIESDGMPLPQVVEARLDAFCLQARRFHDRRIAAE